MLIMLLTEVFIIDNKEIMIIDAKKGFIPSASSVRILADRRLGVGADRILVVLNTGAGAEYRVYNRAGELVNMTAADYKALASKIPAFEVRLTDYFVDVLLKAEVKARKAS